MKRRAVQAVALAALSAALGACSDSGEPQPTATGSPTRAGRGTESRVQFLLDSLQTTASPLLDVRPPAQVRAAVADLEVLHSWADGRRRVALPQPLAAGESIRVFAGDAPVPENSATLLALALPESITLPVTALRDWSGFRIRTTPQGDHFVRWREGLVELPIPRAGVAESGVLRLKCRRLRGGAIEPGTAIEFTLTSGGDEVYRARSTSFAERELDFELPERDGVQTLTLSVEGLPEHAIVELHEVELERRDPRPMAVLAAGVDATATLSYASAAPAARERLQPSSGLQRALTRPLHLAGTVHVRSDVPQRLEVRFGDVVARNLAAERRLTFDAGAGRFDELTITHLDGGLEGGVWIDVPNSALVSACGLGLVEGGAVPVRTADRGPSPLVRHAVAAGSNRRSLLAAAGTTAYFPLEPVTEPVLRFSLAGLRTLTGAGPLGVVEVEFALIDDDGDRRVLNCVPAPLDRWQGHTLELGSFEPGASLELIARATADSDETLSTTVLAAVAELRVVSRTTPPSRPNVLVYLIDTLRADHVSSYGYERQTTPQLDALAADGLLFENAYSSSSWTRPSVATLFTGLLPSFHLADRRRGLGADLETFAEWLRTHGYSSAAYIANAHVHGDSLQFEQGFGEFVGVETALGNSRADAVNDAALPWLERHADEPFFLYLHTIDPHATYDPPPATAGTFQRGSPGRLTPSQTHLQSLQPLLPLSDDEKRYLVDLYDEEILYNDRQFGLLIDELRARDLYENTVIFVVSDHGEEFGDHGRFGHGSGRLWEELIRVPMVLKLSGPARPRGQRIEPPLRMIDVFPTLAGALGLAEWPPLQGVDAEDLWSLPTPPHRDVVAEFPPDDRCFIRRGVKLIESARGDEPPTALLFDLNTDPGETRDLAASDPDRAASLRRALAEYFERERARGLEPRPSSSQRLSREAVEALRALGYVDIE